MKETETITLEHVATMREFLRFAQDEVLQLTKSIEISPPSERSRAMLALQGTILELSAAIIETLEHKLISAAEILLRSVIEAVV